MKKTVVLIVIMSMSLTVWAFDSIKGTVNLKGKSEDDYAQLARISLSQAAEIAQKNTAGKVVEIDLEEKSGFLVYEVEIINTDKAKIELLIDAGDGKVLREERE